MGAWALNGAVDEGSGTAKLSGAQLSEHLWLFLSCCFCRRAETPQPTQLIKVLVWGFWFYNVRVHGHHAEENGSRQTGIV